MIDRWHLKRGGVERIKIAEGHLYDSSSLDEVAPFSLHDVLIYKYEINNLLNAGVELSISGLLADWRSTVELHFSEVADFDSQGFSYFRCFSVKELLLTRDGSDGLAHFSGEFADQFFSFEFKRATYEKHDLKVPLSRDELGWT